MNANVDALVGKWARHIADAYLPGRTPTDHEHELALAIIRDAQWQIVNRPHVVTGDRQSDTSKAAAFRALPASGSVRLAILMRIAFGERGMAGGATDAHLASHLGLPGNTIRPRRGELVTGGWVESSGREIDGYTVWHLTDTGRAQMPLHFASCPCGRC